MWMAWWISRRMRAWDSGGIAFFCIEFATIYSIWISATQTRIDRGDRISSPRVFVSDAAAKRAIHFVAARCPVSIIEPV